MPIKSFETMANAIVAELQRRPGAKKVSGVYFLVTETAASLFQRKHESFAEA